MRKNFSPSFFIYPEGLSWHLRALHQMHEDRCCRETRTVPATVQELSLNIGGAEPHSASIGGL